MADVASRRFVLPFLPLVRCFAVCLCSVFAGCLTSPPPEVKAWTVEPAGVDTADCAPVSIDELVPPPFTATRLGGVTVLPPYDTPAFRVKLADGSLAEDRCNVFAASPGRLLRRPIMSALARERKFGHVLPQGSTVYADAVAEVLVSDLSLDCREGRKARVSLGVNIVKGRKVILSAEATCDADASSGDYTHAFSKAFNDALRESLMNLK